MKGSKLIATVTVLLIALGCLLFTPMTWAEGPFDVDRSTNDEGRNNAIGDHPNSSGEGDGFEDTAFCSGDTPSDWWYMGLVLRTSIQFIFDNLHKADHTTTRMQRSGQQESGSNRAVEHR